MFDIVSLDMVPIFSRLNDLNEEMQQQSLTHSLGSFSRKKMFQIYID